MNTYYTPRNLFQVYDFQEGLGEFLKLITEDVMKHTEQELIIANFTATIIDKVLELLYDDETLEQTVFMEQVIENTTEFFHALSNTVPSLIYQKLTQNETDLLTFNQMANTLVFQFANIKQKKDAAL